jgi:hypothetical protein
VAARHGQSSRAVHRDKVRRPLPGYRIDLSGRLPRTLTDDLPSAIPHPQRGDEGGLGDVDLAELAHPLFAFFLLFEQLSFARHVAAVAFSEDVLAQRLDRLARDDAAADRRLDRDLEELARDQILQPLAQRPAAPVGLAAVHDQR